MQDDLITSVKEDKHIPVLDGLRGFAVLYVMLYHFFPESRSHGLNFPLNLFYGFASGGFSGVDLFFVLSGFLITGILIKSKERSHYFRNFYMRRVLRIFPIYYSLAVVLILIVPHIHWFEQFNYLWITEGSHYPYWLYLMNFDLPIFNIAGHTFLCVAWSLAIEEQYYLVIPTIVYLLDKKRLIILLAAVFIISFLIRTLFFQYSVLEPPVLYHFTFARLEGLSLGGIIRLSFELQGNYEKIRNVFVKALPLLILANVALILFCNFNPSTSGRLGYHPLMMTMGFTLLALMYGSLLTYCIHKKNLVTVLFSLPFMRITGKYSYAMYLLHYIAIWISNGLLSKAYLMTNVILLKNHITLVISGLVLTYILAIASWYLLENPFLKLKGKFT